MQTPPINLATWLLAFSPIATVLVLMVGFRWSGSKAGAMGWVVGLVVAWLFFGAGPELLLYSQIRGLLLTLFVLYIIWMALVLYRAVDEAGAITVIGQGIARLTSEPTMQLLLLAWAFSSFIQGVAGFGVVLAIVAPLLIGLGFAPMVAVAAVSIGHSWSITFGSMASSFQALMAATGLPGDKLAPWASLLLGVGCFLCGIGVVWIFRGARSVRKGWVAILIMGLVMAGVQAGLALTGLWNLGGFGAGLAGLVAGSLVARLPRYQGGDDGAEATGLGQIQVPMDQGNKGPHMSLALAVLPYLILIVVVAAAELWPWLNGVLNQIELRIEFPEVSTSYGWVVPAGAGRSISVFGHAGALLAYAAVLAFLIYERRGAYSPGVMRRIARSTVKSAGPSSMAILTMVGFAVAMENSGMTYVLAQGLSQISGPLYPLISPYIGLLGSFMTGSNTNSNVVFASLQQQAATLLGISVPLILGAQTTGAALGSMLAPARLIVGCSTAGLVGREGQVLKKLLPIGLITTGLIGLLVLAAVLLGVQ
jgi:lactate permease